MGHITFFKPVVENGMLLIKLTRSKYQARINDVKKFSVGLITTDWDTVVSNDVWGIRFFFLFLVTLKLWYKYLLICTKFLLNLFSASGMVFHGEDIKYVRQMLLLKN